MGEAVATFGSVKRPRKIKTEFLADSAFPIDRYGMISLPEQSNRARIAELFEQRRVTNEILLEFLENKFLKVIDAVLSQDEATVRANAEKNFGDKLVSSFD